ncbi:carbonic anhydrase [Rhizobium sp. FY34]|uniref:carbonic anhydrase n=1 Tax=Rhizobium sp. FY34 TaxID=2562309 RepID=UPI0010BF7AE1|nr:carbonic anhydrase [Rhizobium sp. FY34]
MCVDCMKLSRRGLFSLAAGAALAGGLATMSGLGSPAAAKTELTPDQAIERLKAGNRKFVEAPQLCESNLAENRALTAKGQSPYATIVGCADSRVSPELIFGGVGAGELFICRNAGNIADDDVLGSIEYAVEHLGCPTIMVLGHSRCGAVSAACDVVGKSASFPGHIGTMLEPIIVSARAMAGMPGDYVDNVVRENARHSAGVILSSSHIVAEKVAKGEVKIVYGRYDLESGAVDFLG